MSLARYILQTFFSQSIYFLNGAFDNKTFLILIQSNLFIFSFYDSAFLVLFKKSLPIQDLFQSYNSEY